MKKIAFVIKLFQDTNFHGGGEKLFFKLINKFIHDNFSIDIYCSKSNVAKLPGINKITVVQTPYNHNLPETTEDFYNEVRQLIKNENYDFVISENITPPLDITFLQGHSLVHRQRKLKNFIESFFYKFRSVKTKRIKYQEKWLNRGYRKIFAVSNVLKNDIMTNFNIPEDRISVIYPGIDMPETAGKFSLNNKEFLTFGLCAPGFKIKGGYIFLKALKILKEKGIRFKAKIIYPKFRKNLWVKFLVKLYGLEKNLEFLPYQADMQSFYSSIDCLAVPSLEDTFNLTVLEAMANKKPCIVSSYAGASEIIQDGHDGFIFDISKNSAENLAEKMILAANNIENMAIYADNACSTAKKYSWNKTYSEFLQELSKL